MSTGKPYLFIRKPDARNLLDKLTLSLPFFHIESLKFDGTSRFLFRWMCVDQHADIALAPTTFPFYPTAPTLSFAVHVLVSYVENRR